jgi:hypothetical protein
MADELAVTSTEAAISRISDAWRRMNRSVAASLGGAAS